MNRRPRWAAAAMVAGGVALAAVIVVASIIRVPLSRPEEVLSEPSLLMEMAPAEQPLFSPMPELPEAADTVATWILWALVAALGLLILGALVRGLIVLVRVLRRLVRTKVEGRAGALVAPAVGPGAPVAPLEADPELVADGVEQALAALAAAAEPRDGVVAAWVQLEAAAARHGLYRDLAVTPTEFTVALLDATPAPPAATQGLRRLYHRARFSEHPVTPGDVQEAAGYLRAIAEALEVMVG